VRRITAAAVAVVMSAGVVIGLAGPANAATPADPGDPVVKVVQTALAEVNTLVCELFGNSVLCGAT
jgi:hypothetical protein